MPDSRRENQKKTKPKKICRTNLSDCRPISVTLVLSEKAEKIVVQQVQQWLQPALPVELLNDQFAFRPSGSTTSVLLILLIMLPI